MERREYQVTGERSVDGERRRLIVSDFSDHDNVRVLAHQSAQAIGEGQADFRPHLGLVDTRHLIFNRVFNGGNIHARCVENIKHGIEGSGLAGTGRASGENHAGRHLQRLMQGLEAMAVETKTLQSKSGNTLPQEAHHRLFAIIDGQG